MDVSKDEMLQLGFEIVKVCGACGSPVAIFDLKEERMLTRDSLTIRGDTLCQDCWHISGWYVENRIACAIRQPVRFWLG